jgi:outer membrane protein assembly factor BamB
MKRFTNRLLVSIAAVTFCATTIADENAWPLWRGTIDSQGRSETKLPAKPIELWKYELKDVAFEATPIIAEDRVFIGDVDGTLHCLNLKDGSVVWTKPLLHDNRKTGFLAAAAYHDGHIVTVDFDGFVTCFNSADGTELWSFETKGQIDSGANFYNDLCLVTSEDGSLYALQIKDGVLKWKYETGDQLQCSPTVAGKYTFLGGCDGQLHVVDLDKGESIGKELSLGGPTGSTPAVAGNIVLAPTHSGTVLCFDWEKNQQLWLFGDTERTQEFRTSAAISNDLAFVSPRNKRILAINVKSGELVWEHVLRKKCDGSPVAADGRVWIAATDGTLAALNEATGEVMWSEQRTGSFIGSPAIAQQKIIVASDTGAVYCFGE